MGGGTKQQAPKHPLVCVRERREGRVRKNEGGPGRRRVPARRAALAVVHTQLGVEAPPKVAVGQRGEHLGGVGCGGGVGGWRGRGGRGRGGRGRGGRGSRGGGGGGAEGVGGAKWLRCMHLPPPPARSPPLTMNTVWAMASSVPHAILNARASLPVPPCAANHTTRASTRHPSAGGERAGGRAGGWEGGREAGVSGARGVGGGPGAQLWALVAAPPGTHLCWWPAPACSRTR